MTMGSLFPSCATHRVVGIVEVNVAAGNSRAGHDNAESARFSCLASNGVGDDAGDESAFLLFSHHKIQ